MKHIDIVLTAIAIVMAACTREYFPSTEEEASLIPEDGIVSHVIFDVPKIEPGDDTETRSTLVPSGDNVSFVWEVDDTVGIYPDTGAQVFFSMAGGSGSNIASFDGGGWALRQNSTYSCYYPFVGDIYMDKDKIPVSFSGQKQTGYSSFGGAKFYLASEGTSSENGALKFTFEMLNTIIRIRATLPAGTYTKASLTVADPMFITEGTYGLGDHTIVGRTYSNTLEIALEDFTLDEASTVPIYLLSAPVDLQGKEVTVKIISADRVPYTCVKTPSKAYQAGIWYGLACTAMQKGETEEDGFIQFSDSEVENLCVSNWDTDGDGNLSMEEAAAVTDLGTVFQSNKTIASFDELRYFTGLSSLGSISTISNSYSSGPFAGCSNLVSITIPDSVTIIGDCAFSSCSALTSITIPDSVTSIGRGAFYRCSALISISIPDSVTSIGIVSISSSSGTFSGCSNLASITIPNSVATIGNYTFYGCKGLSSITLPDSVTSIGKYAFYGCTGLSSITIPDSVTSIDEYAFSGCTGLTSISISNSLATISDGIFMNCSGLTSITIPDSVTRIGCYSSYHSQSPYGPFYGCSNLTSITIPNSVTIIGDGAFMRCTALTAITIPNSVKIIGDSAFYACSGLMSVTIPNSVTSIGGEAFYSCTGLSSITIPESVTAIGSYLFGGECYYLEEITIMATNPPLLDGKLGNYLGSLTAIYVPSESVDAYKSATNWSDYASKIQAIP